VTKKRSS